MPERLVIDASTAIDLFVAQAPMADAMIERVAVAVNHTSAVFPFEVANGLRREVRDDDAYRQGLAFIDDFPATLLDWSLVRHRVAQLRHNLTSYDASYVAVAELTGSTLLTRDTRLARAPGIVCPVDVW